MRAAALLIGLGMLAACEPARPAEAKKENISIAVSTDAKIILNGREVTEAELKAYFDGLKAANTNAATSAKSPSQ